ncbi:MAG: hypothetical protein ABIT38_10080 [Gemmatimonadaceae bacterium]
MTAAPPPSAEQPSQVAWLVSRAALPDETLPITANAADGGALIDNLVKDGFTAEAMRVLASALPPREGVWWAWAAARYSTQHPTAGVAKPGIIEALDATEKWIALPDDTNRRASWAASEVAGLDTAAGCAAAATFFTAGSIAPAELAVIPPPPGIHTTLVSTAVLMSAMVNPDQLDSFAAAYIAQGVEVVKQIGGWEKSVALAKAHFDAQADQQAKAKAAAEPAGKSASATS